MSYFRTKIIFISMAARGSPWPTRLAQGITCQICVGVHPTTLVCTDELLRQKPLSFVQLYPCGHMFCNRCFENLLLTNRMRAHFNVISIHFIFYCNVIYTYLSWSYYFTKFFILFFTYQVFISLFNFLINKFTSISLILICFFPLTILHAEFSVFLSFVQVSRCFARRPGASIRFSRRERKWADTTWGWSWSSAISSYRRATPA